VLPARKDPFVAGETLKSPFVRVPVHAMRILVVAASCSVGCSMCQPA
jgi:hypothetical protein